ncbi:MAG TPA: R3H domain-containing nucleic acid-binding protein [Thermoanaerobaculia bacterium]|nr:R3H domain-containing nucleic acid-binding protein [Thermoanaerobaculia bacterium]HXT52664.1 R3H domain-containing nucleic acid-binding protein [Thermoanaerobaculia bacterium]
MSGPARRFFSADTEMLAVMEAAAHFGLAPAELAYRPVEKKHGFLRRPKAVIEVDPASPRRPAGSPAPTAEPVDRAAKPVVANAPRRAEAEPAAGAQPSPSERSPRAAMPPRRQGSHAADVESDGQAVELPPFEGPLTGLDGALAAAGAVAALAGLRVSATGELVAAPDGDEVRVELAGAGRGALIARQGELLHSCEHLARRMVRELPGGLSLDSGGFREERAHTLRRRAAAAAEEVRRSGEPVVFEPLPPAERRILHLAVEAEPGVASESEGEGDRRSVRIVPAAG